MSGLSYSEMMLFGIIALLLFGSKLPDVARSLGGTYRQLRKSVDEFQREFQGLERLDAPPPRPTYAEDDSQESTTNAPRFTPPSDESS